jgi:hypothetical protein
MGPILYLLTSLSAIDNDLSFIIDKTGPSLPPHLMARKVGKIAFFLCLFVLALSTLHAASLSG